MSHIKLDRVNGSELRFHFEKFNKIKRFFLQKRQDFSSTCVYFDVKDWRYSNMIWDELYLEVKTNEGGTNRALRLRLYLFYFKTILGFVFQNRKKKWFMDFINISCFVLFRIKCNVCICAQYIYKHIYFYIYENIQIYICLVWGTFLSPFSSRFISDLSTPFVLWSQLYL